VIDNVEKLSKTEFDEVSLETRHKNQLYRNSLMNLTARLEPDA
jgi:hypothetical protein